MIYHNHKLFTLFILFILFFLFPLLSGCGSKAPAPIDPKKTEWLEYYDARYGYALKYPATYMIVPMGNGEVGIKGTDKRLAYRISHVDLETAKKRKLWVTTEPVGTVYISGGHIAHHYVYNQRDGLTYTRMAAYVVEREGKMLAIEFAIAAGNEAGTLDPGQEEALKSFILL